VLVLTGITGCTHLVRAFRRSYSAVIAVIR